MLGPWVDTWLASLFPVAQMNVAPVRSLNVPSPQVPRSTPGQAELSLRLQYSSARAGHGDTSESRVRTEVSGPDTRGTDWPCWVPGQAELTLDHGGVGA